MEDKLIYDVIIVGGGTSGCSCAYNCSKNGLKTLLVEKNNFLGGLMTGGLVVPVMKSSTKDINTNYYKKLVKTAKKYQAQITYKDKNDGWFNPELLKIVLDDVLSQKEIAKNLDILFETNVVDVEKTKNKLSKVILKTGTLLLPIEAKYFIDATGSAELSILSGAKLINDTNQVQQNTLRFILGNVNIEKFCKFIKKVDLNEDITNTCRCDINTNNTLQFTTASTWDTNKIWALDEILKKAVKNGDLIEQDRSYFQIFSVAASTNQVAFNCPRINNYKNNPYKSSLELIYARKAIYRLFNFTKKYFPGFEKAEIVNIATQTGIREQNRVVGKYIYKKEDMLSSKTFENKVLEANYSIDIHSKDKNKSTLTKVSSYEFPLESLICKNIANLFMIGKIISADFETHSALRVQKSCMSMGEAVANYIASL